MASGLLLAVATILLVLARSDHEDCQNRVSKAKPTWLEMPRGMARAAVKLGTI